MSRHGRSTFAQHTARRHALESAGLFAVLAVVAVGAIGLVEHEPGEPLRPPVLEPLVATIPGAVDAPGVIEGRVPLGREHARAAGPEPLGEHVKRDDAVQAIGEKGFRARFAAEDLDALERRASALLLGDASTAEKVALLRVLSDRDAPSATALHALILERLPVRSRDAETLRDHAARRLGELAESDAQARGALRAAAFGPSAERQDRALRLRAAERVGALSPPQEIDLALAGLAGERDALLRQAFENGLAKNPRRP